MRSRLCAAAHKVLQCFHECRCGQLRVETNWFQYLRVRNGRALDEVFSFVSRIFHCSCARHIGCLLPCFDKGGSYLKYEHCFVLLGSLLFPPFSIIVFYLQSAISISLHSLVFWVMTSSWINSITCFFPTGLAWDNLFIFLGISRARQFQFAQLSGEFASCCCFFSCRGIFMCTHLYRLRLQFFVLCQGLDTQTYYYDRM